METILYLNGHTPIATAKPERLSDGSIAYNVYIGRECLKCTSEAGAREIVTQLGLLIKTHTNEQILVL